MAIATIHDFSRSLRIDHGRVPALRLDCGTGGFLLDQNGAFDRHLESLHMPDEYREFPGGHDRSCWDRPIQGAIAFHARDLHPRRPGG